MCRRIAHHHQVHLLGALRRIVSLVRKSENLKRMVRFIFTKQMHNGNHRQRLAKRGKHVSGLERPHESSVLAMCKNADFGIQHILSYSIDCQRPDFGIQQKNVQDRVRKLAVPLVNKNK